VKSPLTSVGITPAYAGRISIVVTILACIGDHPRIRGENPTREIAEAAKGITPAYAGRILCFCCCASCCWDHPRIRGENEESGEIPSDWAGSPPHTRGECMPELCLATPQGITPAYAGRIASRLLPQAAFGDHPRIRGENLGIMAWRTGAGDHPRIRGENSIWQDA